MKKSIYAALIFLLAASGACLAQSDQPTLGELAKRHQATKKASKTLTNDDVATATAPENNQKAAAVASSAPVTTAESPAKSDNKNKKDSASSDASAAKDSPAVAELKKKLNTYKEQLAGWKQSAKRYENLLANETSDFRRQMYQDALEGDKRNVELFQEKVDQTQADLAKSQKGSVSGGSGSN